MKSLTMPFLSQRDRALLYLFSLKAHQAEQPKYELTQQGLAEALDIERTHITRVLNPLVESGFLEAKKGRLEGGNRKLKYYILTTKGLSRAKELLASISDKRLEVVEESKITNMSVSQALSKFHNISALRIADAIDGVLRIGTVDGRLIDAKNLPPLRDFYDREEQLAKAAQFLSSDASVFAIYSNHGYGSSTLLRKVALDLFQGPVLWHDLAMDGDAEILDDRIRCFAKKLGWDNGIEGLRNEIALICLDNYREVSEKMIDFLANLMPLLFDGKAKLAVAIREETPSYARFYTRPDVLSGRVMEVHLHRFDEIAARKMIGEDIDDEAFQLIYMLTRGQPLALAALRDGDESLLRKLRLSEEVRFMMYLRTRRKSK
ncbi:MAG: hypothetical protein QW520_08390 [Methanomassiliicoccales archaeon]